MKLKYKLFSKINNPSNLMRLYTIVSLLSFVLFLFLVNLGIRDIYVSYNVNEAIKNSIGIGEVIFKNERDIIRVSGSEGAMSLRVAPEDFLLLDRRMVNYLPPLGLVKIKVFSKDKIIIYSTDHSIIGREDKDNEYLDAALNGEVDSKVVRKNDFMDLEGEKRFDIDVVETYLPVKDKEHGIVGSYEIYADISYYRAELRELLRISLAGIGLTLFVIFGILFALMRYGTKELNRAYDSLEKMAATDVLTGISNRRYLMSRAEEEFVRIKRETSEDLSIPSIGYLMIDIDHFKNINDTYGHLVGDEILRSLAECLKVHTRQYDIVGRYGGEEFLIVLLNTDFNELLKRAEALLKAVRETPFKVGSSSCNVTVSIGISCLTKNDDDINAVIKRADEGLYKAKDSGRDRVAWV